MNKTWLKLGIIVTVVAALALTAAAVSAAWPGGRGQGFGAGPENSVIAIAAETLGIEPTALITELQAGKSVADVAKDKGVELSTIVDAVAAVRAENLANAVTNGRLTQEQADARLEVLKTDLTARLSQTFEARGFGFGFEDADGDGLCDHAADGGMMGQGMMGHGGMMGRGMMGHGGMMGQGMMGQGMGRGGMWGNNGAGAQSSGGNS